MQITPKSPEQLQAQAAAFANAELHGQDQAGVFNNIGAVVAEGAVREPEAKQSYVDYLRQTGGNSNPEVHGRADILHKFQDFAPTVTKLKAELADPAARRQHPDFLGHGTNSDVFKISQGGKLFAVRIPFGEATHPVSIDMHVASAIRGKGIPHMEQIIAASYEDGVTVAEMMPGKVIGDLSPEDVSQVTDQQLEDLVDTVIVANQRDIIIDSKPSNFLYDQHQGFGIVDYHVPKGAVAHSQDLGVIVGCLETVINNAGLYGKKKLDKTAQDYLAQGRQMTANVAVVERLRGVVEAKLSGKDLSDALERIDSGLQRWSEYAADYSDPDSVDKLIAEQQAFEQARKRIIENQHQGDTPVNADWL
ncbi:MAG: hypothetical protein QG553_99 [Patescibacteria group bacterium]|nr:hypothetical protein [Patescibacteria group bacterium]